VGVDGRVMCSGWAATVVRARGAAIGLLAALGMVVGTVATLAPAPAQAAGEVALTVEGAQLLPASPLAVTPEGQIFASPDATMVSDLSATANVYSAGATQVVYTVKFKAEHELAANSGYVRLTAPAGAKFYAANGYGYEVGNDTESRQSDHVEANPEGLGENVVDVYIPGSFSVAAGETVTIAAYGSENPTSADPSGTFSVSTSADTAAVSVPFAIGPASKISGLSIGADTTSAGASEVVYTATFKSTSALSDGDAEQFGDEERPAFIRLTAPQGTVFSSDGYSYEITDATESRQAIHVEVDPEESGHRLGSNVVDVAVSLPIAAGDTVTVAAYGATNPSSAVPSGEASVSTSSDIEAVSKPLAIGPATAVSELHASANTTSAGASSVVYTASFKATTALSYGDAEQFGDEEKPGVIRLVAPTGTVFNSDNYSYEVSDQQEEGHVVHVKVDPEAKGEDNVVDIDVSPYFKANISAGETVTVAAYGVKNPTSEDSSGQLSVSTTSDVTPVATNFPIGPATEVKDASIGTLGGDYTLQFASPSNISNGDPEQFGDDEQPGFVTLVASAGTTLPTEARYYTFKVTSVQGGTAEYGVLHLEVNGQTAKIENSRSNAPPG